ncbi:MAG: MBL fold metallo-hydrolase, partial [Firmicutes bacterium]|nr:MBL fold metallo-hydrolase [Bacillota bacterium]
MAVAGGTANARVTILVDNLVRGRNLWGEHGLSLLVETGGQMTLFDTGQSGEVLAHNAAEFGLNLADVDSVVLSHGHRDHTGGLASVLQKLGPADLYAHPGVFEKKYAKEGESEPREIGCPISKEDLASSKIDLHLSEAPAWLDEDVVLSGEVVRTTDFEDIPRSFLVERDGVLTADPLL